MSVARVGSPESRPLGIPLRQGCSVSSSDELAVLMGCEESVFIVDCGGTLATLSLAGGSPRELAEHVAYADWTLTGSNWSFPSTRRRAPGWNSRRDMCYTSRIAGWFGHPRFSPDGRTDRVREPPLSGNDEVRSTWWISAASERCFPKSGSLEGLAWSPDGKEVWFAAAKTQAGRIRFMPWHSPARREPC